jgi:alpha-glucosidase
MAANLNADPAGARIDGRQGRRTLGGMDEAAPWWQSAVLYQIYPRSFADSDGDGVGDLGGVIEHLDHLAWLGVDGLWLTPLTPSPNADWGYDVADYCAVDPVYGTLADVDRLVAEARRRKMGVLLDLVPNHTSDRHPWFEESRAEASSPRRHWYVWRDPGPNGSPPNNWRSSFGGPAWTFDGATGQYYLHNFLPEQPDLNWWHPPVRAAFDEIMAFWFARGIAGFRIDVATMIVKDAELRNNPEATPEDPLIDRLMGQRFVYNANRPEVHDVLRHWRRLAEAATPPRLLIGETNVDDLTTLVSYYGRGTDELHLAFNFVLITAPFEAEALRRVVEGTEALLPTGAWPVWAGSNHDVSRLATRWAEGDADRTRCALVMLLTLRGTAVLYQGDEIGLVDGEVGHEQLKDPVGRRFWPAYAGRDPERTPLPWAPGPGAGFCPPDVAPWLPLSDPARANVADQRADPGSILHLVRRLVALRKARPDLAGGAYESLPSPPGVWAYRRGVATTVVLNLTDRPANVGGLAGRTLLATAAGVGGPDATGRLDLGPWQGAVLAA